MGTRLALVVHHEKPSAAEVAAHVQQRAIALGFDVSTLASDEMDPAADVLISIGGDGTVLRAAAIAAESKVPVIGINVGRVGYLAEVAVAEVDSMLAALVAGELAVVERMTVAAEWDGGSAAGINDVVVEKALAQRVVELEIAINERHFTTYRSDGIIVATPLGSTAYSLSAGGPIVDPGVAALILTPVAPHSLLSRSLILAPDAVIHCTVGLDRAVQLNVDGRHIGIVEPGTVIEVRRGDQTIQFLTQSKHPFPQAVRHQFGLDDT